MKNYKKILYILPLAFAVGCAPEFEDEVKFEPGSANFQTYVAVGNSLTAGFQSSALKRDGQENSFPAILAAQFAEIGGGPFKQPLMAAGVGVGSSGNAELKLDYATNCLGVSSLGPVPSAASGQVSALGDNLSAQGPFNNVGVPGAKSFHLGFPGYENLNPFYKRFAVSNETVITAAVRANPTFFSLWIGANDVLSYALAGGSGVDQKGNINPATYGVNDITDPNAFAGTYNQLVAALTANGAKGVVANIPNVTSLPYFSAVPGNGLTLTQAQADQLNAGYAAYNAGVNSLVGTQITQAQANARQISFKAGTNNFVIIDDCLADLTGINPALVSMRQIKSDEYLVLTTPGDSLRCAGWGSQKPIPEQYALAKCEIDNITAATASFNASIKAAADANGLAFVDANKLLSEMESGLTYNGVTYTTTFVTGGLFSLDGFHPNKRGYAVIANEFINAINAKYGAKIRKVDPNSYEGIIFP